MVVQCKRDTKGKSRENFEALVYVVTSCGHLASDFLVMFGFPIITYILERRGTDIFTIVRISFMKYAGVDCLVYSCSRTFGVSTFVVKAASR